jgi:hypothetical protein
MDFNDGESYEKSMGTWSRLVGNKFIEWLSPQPKKEWLDVGCGDNHSINLFPTSLLHVPIDFSYDSPSLKSMFQLRLYN